MTTDTIIGKDQREQFQEEGYFLLERVVPEDTLNAMRAECARFIELTDEEMDVAGVTRDKLTVKGNRYFIGKKYRERRSTVLRRFLFGDLMAEVCRATIGESAYLFHEAFVVKGADQGMKFSWHQDSGYVSVDHKPYVTVWTTLDDVSLENGTVYILPYSKAGTRELVRHVEDPELRDRIGYTGEEEGIPVTMPAGSLAVFSSLVFHRSGPNTTPAMRRIYLSQYSPEPIADAEGKPNGLADPLLKDGARQAPPRLVG